MTDFSALRAHIAGPVFEPGDDGYSEELSGFNLAFTHQPEIVVGALDAADVVQAVRFAHDNALPVRAFATGHGSHATISDGMVISTRRLDQVLIDPEERIATIAAGARWGQVVAAAAEHSLAPITGSSSNVGAIGYLLGGGLGPLARSHGFSSDYVRSFSVVTGTGDLIEANELEYPDLYWALRGGKGGLGIVTAVRVELVSLNELYGGNILFGENEVEPVLRAWVDYTRDADDLVTTSLAIMRFPPIEQVPELMRGKTMLALRFAYPGIAVDGERLVAPLRTAGPAVIDSVGELAPADIATIHNDPTEPGKSWTTGGMLAAVDQDFATALLDRVGAGKQVPLVGVELRHVGSATRREVDGGSAVGGRSSDYTFGIIGSLMQPGIEDAIVATATDLLQALGPWISAETTINFAAKPDLPNYRKAWPADTFERLASVRKQVDPDGIFPYGAFTDS